MSILLSNDDGVHAPGLVALYAELKKQCDCFVIAPDRDRSGVSNCLTLDRPLQTIRLEESVVAVDGTPTDCIHLGTAGIFLSEPEQVVSGINFGANLGDDVLYSGTVAAAIEGRFLAKPAVAISLVTDPAKRHEVDFTQAARISVRLLQEIDTLNLPPRTILNINIPDISLDKIKGIQITTLGQRLRGQNPVETQNPRGKTLYWIGKAGGPVEKRPGSDFYAVENAYISVTPVHTDMTNHEVLGEKETMLKSCFNSINFSDGNLAL